jgi:hypothetical protein
MAFEAWAIVEIMGHVRIAGKVSEQVVAGTTLLRVDVPKTSQHDGYTKFYGASAIYAITPTTEEIVNHVAERLDTPPIQPYLLPSSPLLADKITIAEPILKDIFHDGKGYDLDLDDYDEECGDYDELR